MRPEDKKYIIENLNKKSVKEMAQTLNLKERLVHSYVNRLKEESQRPKDPVNASDEKSFLENIPNAAIIIGILIIALSIKLLFMRQINLSPFTLFSLDDEYYNLWATEISKGDIMGSGVFYGLPLYSYILGFIYFLFGQSVFIARIVQVLLGSLNCVLLYLIGKKTFGKTAGLLASLVFTFYSMGLYFESFLNSTPLSIFMLFSIILLLLSIAERPTIKKWVSLGLLAGLCSLANASATMLILFVIPWAFVHFKDMEKKRIITGLSGMIAALLIVISITTIRNYKVEKDFVPITSHAGITFYAGNNPGAIGSFYLPRELGRGITSTKTASTNIAKRHIGRELKPSEVSSFWFGRAFDFIKNDPYLYARLLAKKLYLFWWGQEIPEVVPSKFIKEYSSILRLPLFTFAIISPLSLIALLLFYKRRREIAILYIFLGSMLLSTLLYFVNSRYRMPAEAILILFASALMVLFFKKLRERKYRYSLSIAASFVLLFFLLNFNIASFSEEVAYTQLGIAYESKGDIKGAEGYFKQALEINPDDANLYFNIGNFYMKQKKNDAAIKNFEDAIRIDSSLLKAHLNLGALYAQRKDAFKAEKAFRQALEINPSMPTVYYNLGILYSEQGRYKDATKNLEEALRLNPNYKEAQKSLISIHAIIESSS
ncbi:MAG: tetratricopeptide repeat protein [Candidatus Omnitrophica bacterium]|nr:tetratricopeptide repeat protein [Candidatus Omnitrophota bacterium]